MKGFLSAFFTLVSSLLFAWGTESALERLLGHEFSYWDYWLVIYWCFLAWAFFSPVVRDE